MINKIFIYILVGFISLSAYSGHAFNESQNPFSYNQNQANQGNILWNNIPSNLDIISNNSSANYQDTSIELKYIGEFIDDNDNIARKYFPNNTISTEATGKEHHETKTYNQQLSLVLLNHDLGENWHSYWKSPGDAGAPLAISWQDNSENIKDLTILWPHPTELIVNKIDDENIVITNSYKKQVSFPLLIERKDNTRPALLNAKIAYMICDVQCIPMQHDLRIELLQENQPLSLKTIHSKLANIPIYTHSNSSLPYVKNISYDDKHIYVEIANIDHSIYQQSQLFIEHITGDSHISHRFLAPKLIDRNIQDNKQLWQVRYESNNNAEDIDALYQNNAINVTAVFQYKDEYIQEQEQKQQPSSAAGKNTHIAITASVNNIQKAIEAYDLANINMQAAHSAATALNSSDNQQVSYIMIILLAFIGGFILNFMPCVLPVLSLKLFKITKSHGKELSEVRSGFIAVASGVIASFWILAGIIIAIKFLSHSTGNDLHWGFQFQNKYFLLFIAIILTFFVCNMLEYFEFRLPSWLANNSHTISHKAEQYNSKIGDFTTGMFATLMATPCTAPFLGTAISFAFFGSPIDILVIFSFVGIGLAFPYIMVAIFPSTMKALPKPGAWMVTFKKILAFLIFLTIIWVVWNIGQQINYHAAINIGSLLTLMIIAMAAGKDNLPQKENHQEESQQGNLKKPINIKLYIPIIILLLVIITYFSKNEHNLADSNDKAGNIDSNRQNQQLKHNNIWQDFIASGFTEHKAKYLADGKIILVDITADWCITCKVNKFVALDRKEITDILSQENFIAIQGDFTQYDQQISDYIKSHGRSGIPLNVIYSQKHPNGIILPEILTVEIVKEYIKKAQ